ncbi:hypothetical protein ACFE04_010851 [Oxalis oulophora]
MEKSSYNKLERKIALDMILQKEGLVGVKDSCSLLNSYKLHSNYNNDKPNVMKSIHRKSTITNEDKTLWTLVTLPAGLITFNSLTKSLDKSWHVHGLGYNPSISMDMINNAAVIHYNGNMKPWLDVAMNQYKSLQLFILI